MSKKLLNAYYNLEEGKLENLLEEVKEQYIDNCLNGGFSGWHQCITLFENGDLELSGFMSIGTQLMSTYEGKSITLTTIDANYESDFVFDDNCLDVLTDEEKVELFNETISNLDEEEVKEKEINDIYDLVNNSEYSLLTEEKFADLFEEKFHKLMYDYFEICWDNYVRDSIVNKIEERIERLKEEVEYEEEY